jgi:hypothetical protein
MPNLQDITSWLGNLTDVVGKIATLLGIGIVVITFVSPPLAGRLMGWWYRKVAIRQQVETAAASPTTAAAGAQQQPAQQSPPAADASAVAVPLPTPPAAGVPVAAPAGGTVALPDTRLRVPRYPRAWWLILILEIIAVGGYVSTLIGSGTTWVSATSTFIIGVVLVMAAWAASTAVRLRRFGWAWGVGISTLILLVFGPFAALPVLLFALIGPVPATGRLRATHPRAVRIAVPTALVTALAFAVSGLGLTIFSASQTYDAVTGLYTVTDPTANSFGLTLASIGSLVALLAALVGLGLSIWAIVNALQLRRWGWAIASLLVGYIPFAFNGPTTRVASAQATEVGS